ncbi:MAG: hypothetical protein CMN71_09330 [Sphingomonadaceae bacterium]|nr:hypothetical protein [Sphingomonadaceae bacterium]
MTGKVISESRLVMFLFALVGAGAIYWATEGDFTSYRTRGREPLVFLSGGFILVVGFLRGVRPTTIRIQADGLNIRRPVRRPLYIPWGSVGGFYEKYPGGIGINLSASVDGHGMERGMGNDADEFFLFGYWRARSELVGELNSLAADHASNSMSQ